MRAFMVKLPSVVRYWTVVDDALVTVVTHYRLQFQRSLR
jgi:hypothetical protein